jgi:hypothetical protein
MEGLPIEKIMPQLFEVCIVALVNYIIHHRNLYQPQGESV